VCCRAGLQWKEVLLHVIKRGDGLLKGRKWSRA